MSDERTDEQRRQDAVDAGEREWVDSEGCPHYIADDGSEWELFAGSSGEAQAALNAIDRMGW